jgi:osmotically-inducible protein OsmY
VIHDLRLEEHVRAALSNDPDVTEKDIAVSAAAGAVTLRGTVSSLKQRRAAAKAAAAVSGVEHVYDLLHVRLLPPDDVQDDEVRAAALQSLMSDSRVPADQIDVEVAARWVTLSGEVKRQDQSDAALEDVAGVTGVGGISNEIKVVTVPR